MNPDEIDVNGIHTFLPPGENCKKCGQQFIIKKTADQYCEFLQRLAPWSSVSWRCDCGERNECKFRFLTQC